MQKSTKTNDANWNYNRKSSFSIIIEISASVYCPLTSCKISENTDKPIPSKVCLGQMGGGELIGPCWLKEIPPHVKNILTPFCNYSKS